MCVGGEGFLHGRMRANAKSTARHGWRWCQELEAARAKERAEAMAQAQRQTENALYEAQVGGSYRCGVVCLW